MSTLFLTERPKSNSEAVREAAIKELLPDVLKWLAEDGEQDADADDITKDLDKALRWDGDGYRLASNLERDCGWSPDSNLVDILDGFSHHKYKAHKAAVQAWVKDNANQIVASFAIGDRVSAKHGRYTITGVVADIKHGVAQYTVRRAGDAPGCGAIVNYEDTEAA